MKRVFDIIFSTLFLIIFSPLILAIALSILIKEGMPVFFIQNRSGINGYSFKFYKFRTMKNIDPALKLSDEDRLTNFGKFLRKYSLDELPSFLNVIKGEMSIVGPRPLLERYYKRYNRFQIRRLEVKPGITGLAQVSGRNNLSWDEKFRLDIKYVDEKNFFKDIKIIFYTVFLVFKSSGISPEKSEIMPEFFGNEED